MKTTLLFLSFFLPVCLFSQSMTNAEVYDFQVGDVMQSRQEIAHPVFGSNKPPTFETRTIIRKSYSAGNDSIIYTVSRQFYTPRRCDTCRTEILSDTITQTVTNLQSPAEHHNGTNCGSMADTTYADACGSMVWERHGVPDTTCFETHNNTTWVIAGLGGPYYIKYDGGGPLVYSDVLIFYKKGNDSCGNNVTGLERPSHPKTAIKIYPNPATDFIVIQSSEKFQKLTLSDVMGRIVITPKNVQNPIDISGLNPGFYAVSVYTGNGEVFTQKLIKK